MCILLTATISLTRKVILLNGKETLHENQHGGLINGFDKKKAGRKRQQQQEHSYGYCQRKYAGQLAT